MTVELATGDKAPAFSLPSDDGSKISLADFKGKKLVLFFYPKADTSGCTQESIDFSTLKGRFSRADTTVIGISADPVAKQAAFKKKHKLTVPLLSDEAHTMLEAYGVWGKKSMYGRTYMGIQRTTVLVGEDGRIARIWSKVKVKDHAEDVLAAAKVL